MSYDKDRNKNYPTRTFKKRSYDDDQPNTRHSDYTERGDPHGRENRDDQNDRPNDRNDRPNDRSDRRNDRPNDRNDRPNDRNEPRSSYDDNEYRWNREGANLNASNYSNQQRYYKPQRQYNNPRYQQNNNPYGGGGGYQGGGGGYQGGGGRQGGGYQGGGGGGYQGGGGRQGGGGGHYQQQPNQRPYDGGGRNNPYVRREQQPRDGYMERPQFVKRKQKAPKKAPARFAKRMPMSARHFASLPRALRAHQFASRQISIDFIKNARVLVNNAVMSDPNKRINSKRDRLMVDAMPLAHNRPIYIIINKPKGLVPSKENNVESIHSLVPHSEHWHFPIGRLNKAATGIVILTNDPLQNNYMNSPFKGIEKEYHVKVQRVPKKTELTAITKALRALQSEEHQKAVQVEVHQKNTRSCWLSMTVFEAKLSEICAILKASGLEVLAFHRYRVGSVTSNLVSLGAWKQMNELELAMLVGGDTSDASFLFKKLDRIGERNRDDLNDDAEHGDIEPEHDDEDVEHEDVEHDDAERA